MPLRRYTGAKGKTWHWGYNAFMVIINPIFTSRESATTITLSNIVNQGFDDGEAPVDYEESYGVTANVSAGVQHARGDDKAEHKIIGFGSPNEQGGAVKLLWDNMPVVATRDEFDDAADFTTADGVHLDRGFISRRTYPWKIWEFQSVGGSTRDVPVLVHHEQTINNGLFSAAIVSTGAALPTDTDGFSLPNPKEREDAVTLFINTIRVVLADRQKQTTLPVAVGQMLMGIFGREKNTLYKLTLKPNIISIKDIGDELRFVMQTEGGSSVHVPVEFVARRAAASASAASR